MVSDDHATGQTHFEVRRLPAGRRPQRQEGDLPVPVLSMHTLGDLFVPFSMEQIYAQRAATFDRSELLVTRAIRDIGHCGFKVAELERGFADLVNWVENDIRPAGDPILDPVAVARPNFGCAFTTERRTYAPACPPA